MTFLRRNYGVSPRDDFRIRRASVTAVCAALIVFGGVPGQLSGQGQSRLKLGQVQQLVNIGTPDSAVAQEIQRRGLDFTPTPKILEELERRGVGRAFVTLHVGAGTFQPVKVEDVSQHRVHREWCERVFAVVLGPG